MVLVVCSFGCTATTPEGFWRKLTRSLCKYNDKCATENNDGTVSNCIDRSYAESQDPAGFADDCDYQSEVGRSCLTYLYEARKACSELDAAPAACENICGPGTGIVFGHSYKESADSSPRAYFVPGESIELP